ncbi:MAG: FkbM family methyltransferase [Pseudohongiellaceae bacterium]
MNSKLVAVVKYSARMMLPAAWRRRAWDIIVGACFHRWALKAVIALAKAREEQQPKQLQRLISMLESNNYRPAYESIQAELGLDFKAFSCQDVIAYIYFNGKPNGFFVDIGAFDGVEISNTYTLEGLGWEGICIEPIPEVFSQLQLNRVCHKYNVAIANVSMDEAKFFKVSKLLGLSGLQQQMPERIQKGLQKQGLEIEQTLVRTMTFDDVMKNHPTVSHIDFLSIDVEGGELEVLQSIDFERFRFGLITIENNPGTGVLRDYMTKQGYAIFLDLGVDLMFVPV